MSQVMGLGYMGYWIWDMGYGILGFGYRVCMNRAVVTKRESKYVFLVSSNHDRATSSGVSLREGCSLQLAAYCDVTYTNQVRKELDVKTCNSRLE